MKDSVYGNKETRKRLDDKFHPKHNKMKAKEFKSVNVRYAENQDQYETLPGHRTEEGEATFCFELSEEELRTIDANGCIWLSILTGNEKLQPIRLSAQKPDHVEI